jgi:MSHA biogenesis protein MshO
MTASRPQGFTLVELILVIVVIGILATLTTSFLGLGSRMYAETADRDKLLSQSRFAIERLTRELRNAMPNSARLHSAAGKCIEFVPVEVASRYTSVPLQGSPASSISLFGLASEWQALANSTTGVDGYRVYVYATSDTQIYSSTASSPGRFFAIYKSTSKIIKSATGTGFDITLNFSSPISFEYDSPSSRIYLVDKPVSYCIESSGQLFRYAGYNFSDNAVLIAGSGSLMAENLDFSQSFFQLDNATLSRNSIAHLVLVFQTTLSGNLFFNQEVHIPNVP